MSSSAYLPRHCGNVTTLKLPTERGWGLEFSFVVVQTGYLMNRFRDFNFFIIKPTNACYHSVQNLLSSSLLSKNLKIKIYRTIILSVVLYGCETWSLTLREEHRLRVFENRVLRRIFGPKRDGVTAQ